MYWLLLLSFISSACVNAQSSGFVPNNSDELRAAVNLCLQESSIGDCTVLAATAVPAGQGSGNYGSISYWNTGQVTGFHNLFKDTQFDQPLYWDTSKGVTFLQLFRNSPFSHHDSIKNWVTSSVTDMSAAFQDNTIAESTVLNWDTSKVKKMGSLFEQSTYDEQNFSPDISSWDLSSVTLMQKMFKNQNYNSNITVTQFLPVFNAGNIFEGAHVRGRVVLNLERGWFTFFNSVIHGDIGLSEWDTSNMISMSNMFAGARGNFEGIRHWDVSNVASFVKAFKGSSIKFPPCWDWPAISYNDHIGNPGETFADTNLVGKICTNKFTSAQIGATVDSSCTSNCRDLGETCATGTDCYHQTCSDNQCSEPPTLGQACSYDFDCSSLEVCASNTCKEATCLQDEYVEATVCKPCPPGTSNEAGDLITVDSQCDPILCGIDEKVHNHECVPCGKGTNNAAGDDSSNTDTSCDPILCAENHRVQDNECVACDQGLLRLAGDRADQANTQCFDASTCGGVTCNEAGTSSCVNYKCVCKEFFGGEDCSKDRSPATRQKKLEEARTKALPSREDIKQTQKVVKEFASLILKEELLKGISVKEAVKNAKIEIEVRDLQQEAQIVVSQVAKTPVLAVGPENKDEDDACDQGPACASLDISEEGEEITFLDTATDAGSWTTLVNGNEIVTKQTKVSEGVYDMQCWNNTWGDKTRVDTTAGGKLYECNGHIILVGSQATICTPTTCQNGGSCVADGLSFSCSCAQGFSGDYCETSSTAGHCHEIDCSDFGGHKAQECSDCSVANCCNYATRSAFDAHCDTLSSTADYVSAKCCHRTYCL